jgi:hypothetical protein
LYICLPYLAAPIDLPSSEELLMQSKLDALGRVWKIKQMQELLFFKLSHEFM